MYTVAQGKALMRSPSKRNHWSFQHGRYESWSGWCCAWVYAYTGASHSFLTATDAFLHTKIVSKNAAAAPAGAIHYWTSRDRDRRPGHVAVSLGNGIAAMASPHVTTSWGNDSGTIPIGQYNRQSTMQYEGWSYDFGGQRMNGVQTLDQVKAATKATPRTHVVLRNEYLAQIAEDFHVPVARIVVLNQKRYPSLARDPDSIQPGWKLALK